MVMSPNRKAAVSAAAGGGRGDCRRRRGGGCERHSRFGQNDPAVSYAGATRKVFTLIATASGQLFFECRRGLEWWS